MAKIEIDGQSVIEVRNANGMVVERSGNHIAVVIDLAKIVRLEPHTEDSTWVIMDSGNKVLLLRTVEDILDWGST